jgi:hypothetical protein
MSEKNQYRTEEHIREAADQLRLAGASVNDRVVSNPDPEEHEPQPMKKQPIVSVNGQDLSRDKSGEELPSSQRPAA